MTGEESALLAAMVRQAEHDAILARELGSDRKGLYMEGWADGLLTLREYLLGGVKASCFPLGSCSCHPALR